jgi:hypothetical protein
MDQPGAAAGWASAGAREATASPRPSHPRGDADDAEASDATSAPREAQAGSAQPSGDAPAPGTVEAAPKKPRPVLKPLVRFLPPIGLPPPSSLLPWLAQLTALASIDRYTPSP